MEDFKLILRCAVVLVVAVFLGKLLQPYFLTILWAFFVIDAGLMLFILGWFAISKIRG